MARPRKLTMDFFIHDADASSDRKIKLLCKKHGNDGYATYFRLLESLCHEQGMKLPLSDVETAELLADDFHLRDVQHLYKIIQYCSDIRLLDKQMWESERVVFSSGLYNRYADRLEDRKTAADRQRRSRESKALQEKIDALNGVVTRDNSVTTELSRYCHSTDTESKAEADPKTESKADPDPKHPELSGSFPVGQLRNGQGKGAALRQFSTPCDRFESWISGALPLCKTGRGPNDWDEPSVQIIWDWLKVAFGPGKTRGDAIAYISKRNHPDRDEYPALLARLEEGFAAKEKQSKAKAVDAIVAPAPADPPPDAAWFEEMRKKALGVS